jgi:hypothetical protein
LRIAGPGVDSVLITLIQLLLVAVTVIATVTTVVIGAPLRFGPGANGSNYAESKSERYHRTANSVFHVLTLPLLTVKWQLACQQVSGDFGLKMMVCLFPFRAVNIRDGT